MPGIEGGPTPEEMGLKPEDVNLPKSDVVDVVPGEENAPEVSNVPQDPESEEQTKESTEASPNEEEQAADVPGAEDKPRWGEVTPEQQEGMDEVQREVAAGLGMLYEVLPRAGKLKDDRIVSAMNQIKTVQTMGPAVKNKIASVITRDKLHEGKKEDFVFKLLNLEYVVVWMMSQGSQRADQKRADTILDKIKNMDTPRTQ